MSSSTWQNQLAYLDSVKTVRSEVMMSRLSLKQWGVQARLDDFLLGTLLEHAGPIVPNTLVPLLGLLSEDRAAIDRAYAELRARHPKPVRFESPGARWQRRYGELVREFEWAAAELVKYTSERDAERIVVEEVARGVEAWAGGIKPLFAGLFAKEHGRLPDPEGMRARIGRVLEDALGPGLGPHMFRYLNFAGFLVGDVTVESFHAKGELVLDIPECAYHTSAGTGEPQTRGCLWVCKAACEKVFGKDSPLTLEFNPRLPQLGCSLRMTWNPEKLRTEGFPGGSHE